MTQDTTHKSATRYPQVEASLRRLKEVGGALRQRPLQDRIDVIGELLNRFGEAGSKWHETLVDQTVKASGFSREGVEAGLRLALEDWHHSALQSLVDQELGSPDSMRDSPPIGHSLTSVILAGVIPMPNLLNTVLPLVIGSPVIVKPSQRDPYTPDLVAKCLSDIDSEFGRCLEVASLESTDDPAMRLFLTSPCVMASGSDETIQQIRSRLSSDQSFIAYGHKFSIAVVNSSSLKEANQREDIAEALSVDIALWDQLGCLSPAAIYVLGPKADHTRIDLMEALAEKLAAREEEWPRGEASKQTRADIRRERDEAEMRATVPGGPDLRGSQNSNWTVIAESEPDWRPTPLHRFVRLYPVSDSSELRSVLQPMQRHLSSAALVGFAPGESPERELKSALGEVGVSRLCPAGRLQSPPLAWPHDGRPVLLPLAQGK